MISQVFYDKGVLVFLTRYDYWSAHTQKPANIDNALLETDFYPAIKDILIMLVMLPATTATCTVKYSSASEHVVELRLM